MKCGSFGRHLECTVCMNRYSARQHVPKILDCGHTFCSVCLANIFTGRSLKCPNCNHEQNVLGKQPTDLPTVHALLGMVDFACECCQKFDRTAKCGHCNLQICQTCQHDHADATHMSTSEKLTEISQIRGSVVKQWTSFRNKIDNLLLESQKTSGWSHTLTDESLDVDLLQEIEQISCHMVSVLRSVQSIIYSGNQSIRVPATTLTIHKQPALLRSSAKKPINYKVKGTPRLLLGKNGIENGQFSCPIGVAIFPNSNNIIAADHSNHRVQLLGMDGQFKFMLTTTQKFPLVYPNDVAMCNGNIVVTCNHRIQIYSNVGAGLRTIGKEGSEMGQFHYPWGVACDREGLIYVSDSGNNRVQVLDMSGSVIRVIGADNDASCLNNPRGLTISPTNGDIVVVDNGNHRIQIYHKEGRLKHSFGTKGHASGQFMYPAYVAVDKDGNIIVSDGGNHRIQVFSPEGTFLTMFGRKGTQPGHFNWPDGVAVTDDGDVVVCDTHNHRVQIF